MERARFQDDGRFGAWCRTHAHELAGLVPEVHSVYPSWVQSQTMRALTAAAAAGDPSALRLGVDFLTVDPPMFDGKGDKARLALALRRHPDRIDRAQVPALFDHWLGLFANEVVPQEGERVARLLGALVDDPLRERALAVPIVLPWVERCIRRIVPQVREELWRRAPSAVRDGDRAAWREFWSVDDDAQVGRAIAEAVPRRQREQWKRRLVQVVTDGNRFGGGGRAPDAQGAASEPSSGFVDHLWQRRRLSPRAGTWRGALVKFASDFTRSDCFKIAAWPLPSPEWRLAPLVARACSSGRPDYVEACWVALVSV